MNQVRVKWCDITFRVKSVCSQYIWLHLFCIPVCTLETPSFSFNVYYMQFCIIKNSVDLYEEMISNSVLQMSCIFKGMITSKKNLQEVERWYLNVIFPRVQSQMQIESIFIKYKGHKTACSSENTVMPETLSWRGNCMTRTDWHIYEVSWGEKKWLAKCKSKCNIFI